MLSFLQFSYAPVLVPEGGDTLVILYDVYLDVAAVVRQLRGYVVCSLFIMPVLEAGCFSRFKLIF